VKGKRTFMTISKGGEGRKPGKKFKNAKPAENPPKGQGRKRKWSPTQKRKRGTERSPKMRARKRLLQNFVGRMQGRGRGINYLKTTRGKNINGNL